MNCKEFESLIEDYLSGVLTDKKTELFEEHYFSCDKCFVSLKISESLKNKSVRIVEGNKKLFPFSINPSFVFASFLIIIFSSVFYFNVNNRSKELMEISRFSPPVYIAGENRGKDLGDGFTDAMKYYTEGNYKDAYNTIVQSESENPKVWFFTGILGLMNNKNNEALRNFNKILDRMDPSYYDEAIFFKGICLLRMDRKEEALKEFRILGTMFTPFREKAVRIIEKINRL